MNLIDYTDVAIMKMLVKTALQLNPWLREGEPLQGPTGMVCMGKLFTHEELSRPANLINPKTIPAHVKPAPAQSPESATVQTIRLRIHDIENGGLKALDLNLQNPMWIHPYTVEIVNREWLEKFNVGDTVSIAVMNPNTFMPSYVETPLTQQMIDDNSEVLFRFALARR